MKEIVSSNANFEYLISNNFMYIDKTEFIHKLITSGNSYFFLSRPRRFGKSLSISTLKSVYQGKKDLFKNLYLGKTDWHFESHPIIYLDFNEIKNDNNDIFREELYFKINEIAQEYSIDLSRKQADVAFHELVKKLYLKKKKGVVILIDEYDKPIISHLGSGKDEFQIAQKNQITMQTFYSYLKPLEEYLEKVFITGVSKFSKTSIFSKLNNLNELDLHPAFADFLGYTEAEMHQYFDEHFAVMSREMDIEKSALYEQFRHHYNGFRFSKKDVRVYNPYSVGQALSRFNIDNYWFTSGTPTFLVNLIKEKNYDISNIGNSEISINKLNNFDISNLNIESILFQTGYLTIRDFIEQDLVALCFPNREVKKGFLEQLATQFRKKN